MTGLIDRIYASGRAFAIDTIKGAQPSINLEYDLEPQLEALARYVADTFHSIEFLQKSAPEKLEQHVVKVLTGSIFGVVTIALFCAAIGSLLVAVTGAPHYFAEAVVYLLLAYAGAVTSVRLLRDSDACIRYDAIMQGFRSLLD